MTIDFTPSAAQRELQAGAREIASRVLTGVPSTIAGLQHPHERFAATRPFFLELTRAGLLAGFIPREYGGGGLSVLDLGIAGEELTAVDINVPTSLIGTGLGLQAIIQFGSDAQKRRFLPDFVESGTDKLASFAFTEVTGGANFDCADPDAGVQTFAERDGDAWVINGEKHWTPNGSGWDNQGAHVYTLVCRIGRGRPASESLAVIVVPRSAGGIEVVGQINAMGHRAVDLPRIRFNNVRVPLDNLLGQPGDGIRICSRVFAWTGALVGAECTGAMRRAFDIAWQFAKTDKRSGSVPVIEHPPVGYQLADIKMRIEACRYLMWKACHYLDSTNGASEEMAIMSKVFCTETAVQTIYDTMRLVGMDSYALDMTPLAALMQDALAFPLFDGGNMGVRRRQLHQMLKTPGYDPMAAAEGRPQPA